MTGGVGDRQTRYIAPTVLAGVQPDAAVMQEEIFGPILPVIAVTDVDEAVRFVNERPAPLALYVFTSDDAAAERVVERTTSGGVTVNHTMLHVAVPDLPFGGVGASGLGAYHGKAGFDTFSHRRSVLAKPARPDVRGVLPALQAVEGSPGASPAVSHRGRPFRSPRAAAVAALEVQCERAGDDDARDVGAQHAERSGHCSRWPGPSEHPMYAAAGIVVTEMATPTAAPLAVS